MGSHGAVSINLRFCCVLSRRLGLRRVCTAGAAPAAEEWVLSFGVGMRLAVGALVASAAAIASAVSIPADGTSQGRSLRRSTSQGVSQHVFHLTLIQPLARAAGQTRYALATKRTEVQILLGDGWCVKLRSELGRCTKATRSLALQDVCVCVSSRV